VFRCCIFGDIISGLTLQNILSGDMAPRNILIRPGEPPAEYLVCDPTDSIYIGKSGLLGVPVFWDFKRLANPHIAVMGMTGSGKSYFIKAFISRASLVWNSNALILDFAGEYVPWVEANGGKVIRLGGSHCLNILETGGLKTEDRARQVISSLEILTDISNYPKQKRLTLDALDAAYAKAARKKCAPTFYGVEKELAARLSKKKNDEDLEGALHRVRQFLKKGRDYFARPSTVPLESISSSGLVCLDLSSLPSEADRSLAALAILQYLREKMRVEGYSAQKALKLIIVADEAWKIAQDDRSDLVAIIREGRKYSFGLIVSSQNPTDMSKSVLSNAGTVFAFRQALPEFKAYVQQSMNYGPAIASKFEKLSVGQAAVHMSFFAGQEDFGTFIVSRVEGEALPALFRIRGGSVELEIERGEFRKRLFTLGLSDPQADEICSSFEKNERAMHASGLVALLSKFGCGRGVVLVFLRELGLSDDGIAGAFASVQASSYGVRQDKIADLVIDDE